MNKFIENLIGDEKVEWLTLGEVCEFSRGKFLSKKDNGLGYEPMILYGELYTTYGNNINNVFSRTSKEKAQKATIAKNGDLLLPISSTTKEAKIGKVSALMTNFDVYCGGDILVLSHKQNPSFLTYYLNSKIFERFKMDCVNGTTIMHLSPSKLAKTKIPIPPLQAQREIVRILDAFTLLTAELTAELTARQKQYEYYRDKLLSFDELDKNGGGYELKMLGEVGKLIRGNGLQKKDFTDFGVPAIHYGQIYTYYGTFTYKTKSFVSHELAKKLKKVDCGDVILTNTSENFVDVGKAVAYFGQEQAVTGGHATIFKPSDKILSKYFVYYTQTSFFLNEKRKYAKGTKVIDISTKDMSKIQIPIPPIEKQREIVEILDKFETLTNDIKEGLPREIELRQKQYEYYRDLLLDFEDMEIGA